MNNDLEGFKIHRRSGRPDPDTPSLTIRKNRAFGINRAAFSALGEPDHVELLFNPTARVIAIRPASADSAPDEKYRVGRVRDAESYAIGAYGFVDEWGLNHERAQRYPAEAQGGILQIQLGMSPGDGIGRGNDAG